MEYILWDYTKELESLMDIDLPKFYSFMHETMLFLKWLKIITQKLHFIFNNLVSKTTIPSENLPVKNAVK